MFSNLIISNFIYIRFLKKFKLFQNNSKKNKIKKIENKKIINKLNNKNIFNDLLLLIGKNKNNENIYIPENGLYQNFLITRNYWLWENQFSYVPLY